MEVQHALVIDWNTIIGFIGLATVIVGGAWARDRQLTNASHKRHEELTSMLAASEKHMLELIKAGDDQVHERISRLRDEVSKGYVRSSDLDGHLTRIEKSIGDLRVDIRGDRELLIQALSKFPGTKN